MDKSTLFVVVCLFLIQSEISQFFSAIQCVPVTILTLNFYSFIAPFNTQSILFAAYTNIPVPKHLLLSADNLQISMLRNRTLLIKSDNVREPHGKIYRIAELRDA